jgi:hypothetical protein
MNTDKPPRSALISILAILAIAGGALGSIISVISGMMVFAGSYGTANANPLEALVIIAGPPFCAATGVGLLARKRWAWFAMVGILFFVLAWQAWQVAFPPPREDRTTITPSGVRVTVSGSGPTYSVPIIATSIAMLVVLFSRKSRAEFPPARRAVDAAGQPTQAQQPSNAPATKARQWRTGHRGRDQMYYEELHGDTWLQLQIDGEMLMGRPHHVIYFASAENWLRYPEWARHRRDEIMGRIKLSFREPDYEYAEGGTAYAPPPPDAPPVLHAGSAKMKPSELRAVIFVIALFVGIAVFMGWLVVTGLEKGETRWPAKRPSLSRTVVRMQEPAMYWTSIGLYSLIGTGSLGFAVFVFRASRK